jgi:hypothetical protein
MMWSYSANGQLLTTKNINIKLEPKIMKDSTGMDMLVCVEDGQLTLMNTPLLNTVRVVSLPSRYWTCWCVYAETILLGTSIGEVIVVSE